LATDEASNVATQEDRWHEKITNEFYWAKEPTDACSKGKGRVTNAGKTKYHGYLPSTLERLSHSKYSIAYYPKDLHVRGDGLTGKILE